GGQFGVAPLQALPSRPSRTQAVEAPSPQTAVAAFQDGAGTTRTPALVMTPAVAPARLDPGTPGAPVAALRLAPPRGEAGGGAVVGDEAPEAEPAAGRAPTANVPAPPFDPDGPAAEVRVWQRACDACFADDYWTDAMVTPAESLTGAVAEVP